MNNKLKFLGLGYFYIFFCRKSNDLWVLLKKLIFIQFENDFRDTFPEIFHPYKRRFDFSNKEGENNNIIQAYNSLNKNEEFDIINKRRNKKMLEKEHLISNLNQENNYNKLIKD